MPTNKPSKLVVADHLQSCDTFNNYIDIVNYLLKNSLKNPKKTIQTILTTDNSSEKGFRFEALSIVLVLLKCVQGFNYTEWHEGTIFTHKKVNNPIEFLSRTIVQGGNDIDMCFINKDTTIGISCKYNQSSELTKDKQGVINIYYDCEEHNKKRLANGQEEEKCKVALFVRDKNVVLQHKYKDKNGLEKNIIDKIIKDNLLFDESDLLKAIACFNSSFKDCTSFEDVLSIADFKRKQLVKMLHQRIAEIKFQRSFDRNYSQNWCISHKPRSGKSITLLLIAKHMLMSGFKRILVLTSVPATFESFRNALNTYVDFKGINHISQDKCHDIPCDFTGIIFCSVQFLKIGKDKVDLIKYLNFEGIIADEAHLAISTNKTKSTLQMNFSDSSEEIDEDVVSLCSKAKSCVFASGTSLKTLNYYKIPASRNYTWDIEDESFMKAIIKQEADASIFEEAMKLRHGQEYSECRIDITLNQDYDKYPTLMLMRYIFPKCIVSQIDEYNKKYKADIGMSFKSILALRVDKERLEKKKPCKQNKKDDTDNKKIKYLPQFKLDEDEDGCDMLKAVFEQIVSRNRNQKTILKKCETIQTERNSRKNSNEEPKLIIIYLPMNTGNSTILELQQATKAFIEKHNLWPKYTIEYTSSMGDSCDTKESYDKKIQSMLKKAKDLNKRGCILLLGNQGRVGITYKDCDITISIDDGHNLEQKKQSDYRAMTEAPGKTIGINVDMNVQRYYTNIMRYLTELRKRIGKNLSNAEILHFAYKNNILVVGPDEFSDCIVNEREVTSYFKKLASEIASEIDDSIVLNSFECDDELRHMIIADIKARQSAFQVENGDSFEGLQQDLNKGVVKPDITRETKSEAYCENEVSDDVIEEITNKTLELFRQYLLPLLALISRSTKNKDFSKIIESTTLSKPIWEVLGYKKIELEKSKKKITLNIMKAILENNEQIVSQIREIYETASHSRLRTLIERHFPPSDEEKNNHAEIPTPVKLVDNMLEKMPINFWSRTHRVYEPCCGKGNFVLGIFDKFFNGLEKTFPDEIERCKVIATECIYFADISPLNVFITTELMKCHIQSYCGIDELDYEFNSYVGDTSILIPMNEWNIEIDAVIGNPPYTKNLYKIFTTHCLSFCKMLLFVIPSTFTIGVSHKLFIDLLKNSGLKNVMYLEKKVWNHKIDIDTLYLFCEKGYIGNININGVIVNRNQKLLNITPEYHSILKKIACFNRLELFKGKNKTLNYKSPIETENIKFNKSDTYCYKLLSRLNGGKGEQIYYTNKNCSIESGVKVLFPRGTGSYNSKTAICNISKPIVFSKIQVEDILLSTGIVYFKSRDISEATKLQWYITRSKFVRYLLLKENKFSELTKGFVNLIPSVNFEECEMNDESIYKYLCLSEKDIKEIESVLCV
jgi:hypothetical protein